MSALYARVAFNVRVPSLFDYKLPATRGENGDGGGEGDEGYNGGDDRLVGRRVLAPLGGGNKKSVGVIMEITAESAVRQDKLKTLIEVYDDMPPLPAATLKLIRFCSEYYHCPIGMVAASVLPTLYRRANYHRPPAAYRLCAPPPALEPLQLSGRAAAVAAFLQSGAKTAAEIKTVAASPYAALKKLTALGVIERCLAPPQAEAQMETLGAAQEDAQHGTLRTLSAEQKKALEEMRLEDGFVPHLLFGATGSGKSEIYRRAAERVLARGRQLLILTPEIHLTPQLEADFRRRFPARRVVCLHSGMAEGARARGWLAAQTGEADIVLGTRLAVFTPMPALGLIIVDEEHDESYKQADGGLLFSARNVAAWRAKNENVPFIAGSATPSLESLHNARRGSWRLLQMRQRLHAAPLSIDILPQEEQCFHGMGQAFLQELSAALKRGEQCLVFINRRGYAPALVCRDCQKAHPCKNCSANMTVHRRRHLLICHLCGERLPLPLQCVFCGGAVRAAGSGTQRVEAALAGLHPQVNTLRMDSDMGARVTLANAAIKQGDVQLLIGTQLLAKGHNFPKLSFIGILNADAALMASDMRAEERLFALLSQVIGRGTRNPNGCRVLIQSEYSEHAFYRELRHDDVNACWTRLLQQRAQSALPPFARLAVLRGKDKNLPRLEKLMRQLLAAARRQSGAGGGGITVFDIVAPPVEKISQWHRRQIVLHSRSRRALQNFLRDFKPGVPPSCAANWCIEVDPLTI